MLIQNKKRIMFYMHYDIGNIIDEHIVYQIKAYAELGIEIVFISNSTLSEFELDKVRPLCRKTMLHHNKGFDFTSWKDAILAEGWDFFNDYDQLIITNSSCYGPIFPLAEMFDEMDKRNPDWWGVAERSESYGFISHVISSFAAFSKKVFTSELFRKFWLSVRDEYSSFWEVIRHGELRLTETLNKQFKYDVYCKLADTRSLEELGHLETFFTANAGYFCEMTKSPFLKVKAFANARTNVYSHADEIFAMLKRVNSIYPEKLIINHQFRTSPLSWFRNFPEMLQTIDDNKTFSKVDLNIFILLTEEKLIEFYSRIFKQSQFPLFIAVSAELSSKYEIIEFFGNNVKVKIISENLLSASWGKILSELFPELLENNKILLINNFKNFPQYSDFLNFKIQNHVATALLGSFERISNIAEYLQKTTDTAMLAAPLAVEQIFCNLQPLHTADDIKYLKNFSHGNNIAMESSIPVSVTYCCYIKSDAINLLKQHNFFDLDNKTVEINSQTDRLIAYILQKFGQKTRFITSSSELISENNHLRDKSVSLKVNNFKKHLSATVELAGKACVNFYHSLFPASFTHKMMYFEEPAKQFLKKLLNKK